MYADTPFHEPWSGRYADPDDRVAHLVFVDGRLVDSWYEPAFGTRWQQHADRFDAERRPPSREPDPPYVRVLAWLRHVCGDAATVEALSATALTGAGLALPEVSERVHHERMRATAELLNAVAERCFDTEMSFAFRRALLLVWAEDPDAVVTARSAAHVAGGICWAVGKANGSFRPAGDLRVGRVQEALALSASISTHGHRVRSALWGFRSLAVGDLDRCRPSEAPDLLPLGHADLLVAATRERLVRLRDRAAQARDLAA